MEHKLSEITVGNLLGLIVAVGIMVSLIVLAFSTLREDDK